MKSLGNKTSPTIWKERHLKSLMFKYFFEWQVSSQNKNTHRKIPKEKIDTGVEMSCEKSVIWVSIEKSHQMMLIFMTRVQIMAFL